MNAVENLAFISIAFLKIYERSLIKGESFKVLWLFVSAKLFFCSKIFLLFKWKAVKKLLAAYCIRCFCQLSLLWVYVNIIAKS